ncbi:hypothetical protein [Pectobacterium sp. A5351]|uniref:hypothetical protein n=1 Tax=Pectobacterium sp. A5351 TaxID=2914983 RepID=UPI00232F3AEF|nr:hypothetical protein [Pectobacterium sp. A5351]WCG81606.1 hypothetical protein O1Q74_11640 [Pectobacterium sp. A5351]
MAKIIISVQQLPAGLVNEDQVLSQSINVSIENETGDIVVTQLLATMIKDEMANAINAANTRLMKHLNAAGMSFTSQMMRNHRDLH